MDQATGMQPASLPLLGGIRRPVRLTLAVALLMALTSLAGWFLAPSLYPTSSALDAFPVNDLTNLVIGLPILPLSMALAARGKLLGLLFWPGALLYVIYNYIAYLVGVPLGVVTLSYAALIVLSTWAIFDLMRQIDSRAVRQRLQGKVFERWCGGVLFGFGALFGLRALAVIAEGLIRPRPIPPPELGVLLADLILGALAILVGIQLFRRERLGYALGPGLLFQTSMLFLGLIVFLLLQPALTGTPLALADLVVVAVMAAVFSLPLVLLVRRVVATDPAS